MVAAEEYRRQIQRVMNDDIVANAGRANGVYMAGPELWKNVRDFNYSMPGTAWVLGNYRMAAFALLGWLFVAILFSAASSAALKVR
jgi:hypothetical protein